MSQNLGSQSKPLSLTGEQWVLEERTNDPASPADGECWIRTDLDNGNAIGTLKFGDGSEVPIFPTGTSEPGVLEVRRIQTGGQTGYVPVAEPSDARFEQFRLQHDNTVYSLHDDIEPSAIPDSDILQFEDGTLHPSFTGDTGTVEVTDASPVLSGTFSAKYTGSESTDRISTTSNDLNLPEPGRRFSCYTYVRENFSFVGFGNKDDEQYGLGSHAGINEIALFLLDSGGATDLTSRVSVSMSNQTWYDFEVEWETNGDITGRVFDVDQSSGERQGSALASISANDTQIQSRGAGLGSSSSNAEQFAWDNYRILEEL